MALNGLSTLVALHEAQRRDLAVLRELCWDLRIDDRRDDEALVRWFGSFRRLVSHQQEVEVAARAFLRERPHVGEDWELVRRRHAELEGLAGDVAEALGAYASAEERVARVVWRGSLTVRVTRFSALLLEHASLTQGFFASLAEPEQRAALSLMRRKTPLRIFGILLPLLLSRASAQDEARALRKVSWVMRVLYRWRWKPTYARLAQPLLRAAPAAVAAAVVAA